MSCSATHDSRVNLLMKRLKLINSRWLCDVSMNSALTNLIFRWTNVCLLSVIAVSVILVATLNPAYSQESGSKKKVDVSDKVPAESGKATAGISFSEQTLGESDSVYVQTWFPNETGNVLTEVNLEIFGPEFLEWHDKDCRDPQVIANPFLLGVPAPYTVVEHRFCINLKSGQEIKTGDFNILFIYHYQWKEGETSKKSVLSIEKPLKIVLLGNDNIVGIPFGLAGLVIPGLFFWFAVGLWKAPWGMGLALGEKLFYSIIVSAVFVAIGAGLSHIPCLAHKSWILNMDVLKGISLGRLVYLALTGMVMGTIAGGIDKGLRLWRRKQLQKRTIKSSDPALVLLEKLLLIHSDKRKPQTIVRLKEGNVQFSGSLGAQTDDTTVLVGRFKVRLASFPEKSRHAVQNYVNKNRLIDILELARSKNVPITMYDGVQNMTTGISTGEPSMTWKNDQVAAEPRIEPGKGQSEPLVLD